ncbi:MAG: outer membrane lipoprotein carrier protein LolA [Desulfuromonadales bacterium]|nr:outer membrane lipoprotein carrier protein LolA [Desulfuromonadales bacterium]
MKKTVYRIVLFFGFCLLAVPVAAESIQDVITTLESPFRSDTSEARAIHDIETEFTQESTIASLDRVQKGGGRVLLKFDYQRTDRVPRVSFRWEYDFPTRQEIVSNGKTFWAYIPENNQVIQTELEQVSDQQPDSPLTFLTGLGNLSRDFLIRWASPSRDAQNNYILFLTPKRTTSTIQSLTVVVDRRAVQDYTNRNVTGERFPIIETRGVDPNDNVTLIRFDQQMMRVNRGISDSFFNYMLPAGVDVVRPTGSQFGR